MSESPPQQGIIQPDMLVMPKMRNPDTQLCAPILMVLLHVLKTSTIEGGRWFTGFEDRHTEESCMESAVASDSLTALGPFMEGKAGQVYYSHAIVA